VEKNQYNLCLEVLRRLDKAGVLKNFVLIGSWCLLFYKDYFAEINYSPSIKTRDIDFLVPRPSAIKTKANIFELVKDLGFIVGFKGREGYIVLEHPELEVEFLVPERGKGSDIPTPLPQLGLNAQALRFLELLSRDTIQVEIEDISLPLPHPANFGLHKLIIASRRRQKDKAAKDREAGLKILKALIEKQESTHVKHVIDSLPEKWQGVILKELGDADETDLIKILFAEQRSAGRS